MSAEAVGERENDNREKKTVAAASVLAAVLLTGLKLVVGISTGSLGILAEAAHSGLDLVATIMTLWAVWISGKPADPGHTYGHGKFENLSALFQTLLLLITCVWIIYESIHRLFFVEKVEVDANFWAFAVIVTSIVIDYWRSTALSRIAKKHHSQALEADALHFSTDIWSSAVVLLGLLGVFFGNRLSMPWLVNADSVAALGVSVIVIGVSYRLGKKSIDDLVDTVPNNLQEEVHSVVTGVCGVERIEKVRLRKSGPEYFADITFSVNRAESFEKTHEIANRVEDAVRSILPKADVVVHVEPVAASDEDVITKVRMLAAKHGLGAHAIRIYDRDVRRSLELHLEISASLSLEEAHHQATAFENELSQTLKDDCRIITHLEPEGQTASTVRVEADDRAQVWRVIHDFLKTRDIALNPHELQVQSTEGKLAISFHCKLDPSMNIAVAHDITDELERHLKAKLPSVSHVLIHVEPA